MSDSKFVADAIDYIFKCRSHWYNPSSVKKKQCSKITARITRNCFIESVKNYFPIQYWGYFDYKEDELIISNNHFKYLRQEIKKLKFHRSRKCNDFVPDSLDIDMYYTLIDKLNSLVNGIPRINFYDTGKYFITMVPEMNLNLP